MAHLYVFRSADNGLDVTVITSVYSAFLHHLMTSKFMEFGGDRVELVRRGIGRFSDKAASVITVDEPMILLTAASWLFPLIGQGNPTSRALVAGSDLERLMGVVNTFDPTYAVGWHLIRLFGISGMMTDLLMPISGTDIPYDAQPARLIALKRGPGSALQYITLSSRGQIPLASEVPGTEEVISFISGGGHGFLCRPISCPVADLVFALQRKDNKIIWLLLKTRPDPAFNPHAYHSALNRIAHEALPHAVIRLTARFPGMQASLPHSVPLADFRLDKFKHEMDAWHLEDITPTLLANFSIW